MFPGGIGGDVYLILLAQVLFLVGYLYWVHRQNRSDQDVRETV